jgi:carboxymethylenebutenolidase
MKDRLTIEGRDGAFGAYIARPKASPALAVVVLHEVFGVNAGIRKTCDETGRLNRQSLAHVGGVPSRGRRFNSSS